MGKAGTLFVTARGTLASTALASVPSKASTACAPNSTSETFECIEAETHFVFEHCCLLATRMSSKAIPCSAGIVQTGERQVAAQHAQHNHLTVRCTVPHACMLRIIGWRGFCAREHCCSARGIHKTLKSLTLQEALGQPYSGTSRTLDRGELRVLVRIGTNFRCISMLCCSHTRLLCGDVRWSRLCRLSCFRHMIPSYSTPVSTKTP
jgi:hypothetical protein